MPTKERMNRKRNGAIKASDHQIAEYIWSLVEEIFDSYEGYELEKIDFISVTLTEKVDCLKKKITIKETDEIEDETFEKGHITLSAEKLERLDYIMPLVMKLAEKEGVLPWDDKNDDHEHFWGFHVGFGEEEDE